MPTFVHTADVHFDTPFSARFSPRQAALRRKEIMQTFQTIVNRAKECDFFLISGDLFDGRYISMETISFLKRCFSEMSKTQVLIAAGNHDPLTASSPYMTEKWGENVHIFNTAGCYFDFPSLETRIHGRSFSESHHEYTLLSSLDFAEGWNNILVIHGEVVASGGKSDYNPLEKPLLESCRADYAALGHIHQYSKLQKIGNTCYAYPGIPEGRGFDEEGEKGYIEGEIENGQVTIRWIPVNRRCFRHIKVDLTGVEDGILIPEKIKQALEKAGSADDLYKISLIGRLPQEFVQIDFIQNELAGRAFYLELCNDTMPDYHFEDIAKENSLRGAFVSEMLKRMQEMPAEEQEMGRRALIIGLRAMEGGESR